MRNKFIFALLLVAGCGNDVKIKNSLENLSPLTESERASFEKSGTLNKGATTQIYYQGKSYQISPYSSKSSQDFIKGLATGTSLPVVFTGGIDGSLVVIETIKRQ
jgi:hypothetical protein